MTTHEFGHDVPSSNSTSVMERVRARQEQGAASLRSCVRTPVPPPGPEIHSFQGSYEKGARGEELVREFLVACGFKTKSVNLRSEQKAGKDFFADGVGIEVKTDDKALETGRVYIETVSNDQKNKPGWAVYTKADIMLYIVGNTCHVCSPEAIRSSIMRWARQYPVRTCQNKTYASEGILVPLAVFEREVVDYSFDLQQYTYADMDYLCRLVDMVNASFEAEREAQNESPFKAWMREHLPHRRSTKQ